MLKAKAYDSEPRIFGLWVVSGNFSKGLGFNQVEKFFWRVPTCLVKFGIFDGLSKFSIPVEPGQAVEKALDLN